MSAKRTVGVLAEAAGPRDSRRSDDEDRLASLNPVPMN
jgi:hypothetical protein